MMKPQSVHVRVHKFIVCYQQSQKAEMKVLPKRQAKPTKIGFLDAYGGLDEPFLNKK